MPPPPAVDELKSLTSKCNQMAFPELLICTELWPTLNWIPLTTLMLLFNHAIAVNSVAVLQ